MTQTLVAHFNSLLALGVMTEAQCQRALAHERLMSLTTVESDADALFRAAICGVVTEKELEELAARFDEAQASDPGQSEKRAIVDEALGLIDAVVKEQMRGPLDALLALGLITADQHEAGLDIRPMRAEGAIDGPARALAVLVNRGIVEEERLVELKAQGLGDSQDAGAKERLAVVTEAARIYHEIVGQFVKAMGGGALRLFGLIMLAVFGLIGLVLWLR